MSTPRANKQSSQHGLKGRVVFAIVEVRRTTFQGFKHDHFALALHVKLLHILLREDVMGVEQKQRHTSMSPLVANVSWPAAIVRRCAPLLAVLASARPEQLPGSFAAQHPPKHPAASSTMLVLVTAKQTPGLSHDHGNRRKNERTQFCLLEPRIAMAMIVASC